MVFSDLLVESNQAAARLYRSFIEESPKVREVYHLALELVSSIRTVHGYWDANQGVLRESPMALENYGIFNKYMVNEAKKGEELMRESTEVEKRQVQA